MPNLDAAFRATIDYRDVAPGETFMPHSGLTVASFAVDHPGGALAYRIAWGGASLSYVTDAENAAGPPDAALAAFVAGADLLICDASYSDAEYPDRVGWGHSTWEGAIRLANAAGAGTLVLFHHDFAHDDDTMDSIAAAAATRRPGTLAAREGLEITLSGR